MQVGGGSYIADREGVWELPAWEALARAKSYALIAGAWFGKAAFLIWLWAHGFPQPTADSIIFKQPGYLLAHGAPFSLPTAAGWLPHAEQLFAAYVPGYVYANAAVFWLFGTSIAVSHGFDMAVHAALVFSVAAWLARSVSPGPRALFILASTFLLTPIGRPEELATLLAALGLRLAWTHRSGFRYVAGSCLLGASLATSILIGVVALCALLHVHVLKEGFHARSLRAWARGALTAGVFAGSLLVPLVIHGRGHAFEQFSLHAAKRYAPSFFDVLRRDPRWTIPYVSMAACLLCGVALLLWLRRLRPYVHAERTRAILALPAFFLSATLIFALAKTPSYLYRPISYFLLAASCYVISALRSRKLGNWLTERLAGSAMLGLGTAAAIGGFATITLSAAPLAWKRDAVGAGAAIAEIERSIPRTASVGGDGALWWLLQDGRPFLALRWLGDGHWPEYVISRLSWKTARPMVLEDSDWAPVILERYERVDVFAGDAPCLARFGPVSVEIASGNCDFRFALWRKRAASQSVDPHVGAAESPSHRAAPEAASALAAARSPAQAEPGRAAAQ